jgi:branched-chain amino acid transport system permease protein
MKVSKVFEHAHVLGVDKLDMAVLVSLFIITFFSPYLPRYVVSIITELLIFSIYAIHYYLLYGVTGQFSYGQCVYFGIGAYSLALSIIHLKVNAWVGLLLAICITFVFATFLGFILVQMSGSPFIVSTIIISVVLQLLTLSWRDITGGEDGITFTRGQLFGFANPEFTYLECYVLSLLFFILSYLAVKVIASSPLGLILRSIKENPLRTECLGYNVTRYKFIAFIISSVFAGLSGALFALYCTYSSAAYFDVFMSVNPIIWTLIGGENSIIGPIIGCCILHIFKYFSSYILGVLTPFAIGIIIILILKTRARGIVEWLAFHIKR